MPRTSRLLATVLLVAGMLVGAGAIAQSTAALDAALLDALTPALRTEVEARMRQNGQKVHEVIDTILLNKISLAIATNRIVATDYVKGIAVVETREGQIRVVAFDIRTLEVRPN